MKQEEEAEVMSDIPIRTIQGESMSMLLQTTLKRLYQPLLDRGILSLAQRNQNPFRYMKRYRLCERFAEMRF